MDTAPFQEAAVVGNESAAPAAGAVLADSGALVAGLYDIKVEMACSDTPAPGRGMKVEHRNAANNATIRVLGGATPETTVQVEHFRYRLAANERVRVIAGTAAAIAASMYVSAVAVTKVGE